MTTENGRGREQAERRLLAAARRLFAEQGPDAVSLRDVARAAGVNHGLIHHYIGTREDLLARVFAASELEALAGIREAADVPAVVATLRASGDGDGEWVRLLAWTILTGRQVPGTGTEATGPTALDGILAASGADAPRVRAAVAVALLQSLALDLFGDFVQQAVGLAGDEPEVFRDRVDAEVDGLIATVLEQAAARPAPVRPDVPPVR